MPVTKTAKRALRGSQKKSLINKSIMGRLEIAVRKAKKTKTQENVRKAISLSDRAAKKKAIHKNKAARIKAALSRLVATKNSKKTSKIKK